MLSPIFRLTSIYNNVNNTVLTEGDKNAFE